jgi:hypothetical protein
MKRVGPLIALLTVAGTALAEITSADLKHCPDGHTTLKDVPISYGVPAPDDWKKMQRQLDNLEFVLGGCEPPPNAPHFQPTCTTCRFGFDSTTKTWSRRSSDTRSFKRRFSTDLTSFPIPGNMNNILYRQWVRDNVVVRESVSYTIPRDSLPLRRRIGTWLRSRAKDAKLTKDASLSTGLQWRSKATYVLYDREPHDVFVWLLHDDTPKGLTY